MDTSGNRQKLGLNFIQPPQRIISLVPSMTESLFDLGLGKSIVGITNYCIHPKGEVSRLPKVGGTKDPDFEKIINLKPDLVLANQEENPAEIINELEKAGFNVWLSFPKTVREAMDILWSLVNIFHDRTAGVRLETLEITLDWAESALHSRDTWHYFCPIWMEDEENGASPAWWMTFNQNTYMNDVLRLMGGVNVFGGRERKYPLLADLGMRESEPPGNRDVRYPRVTRDEILEKNPEVILLPDEPYNFTGSDSEKIHEIFKETSAVQHAKIIQLDGSLLSWHGTRLAKALNELPLLFDDPEIF